MRLFIEPTGPLMFRTGRPFDAGTDTFAESLFPPTLETLQGAVRATIANYWNPKIDGAIAFNDTQLTGLIGDRNGYGRFRLTGITLGRCNKAQRDELERQSLPPGSLEVERLFPPPAHIMQAKDKSFHRLLPQPYKTNVHSNMPEGIHHYLASQEECDDALKPIDGWLTETTLYKMLSTDSLTGIDIEKEITRKSDIYQEEPRLGIGMHNRTKASAEGFLYQTVMIRMNHKLKHDYIYGFVVDIDLAPLSSDDEHWSDQRIQEELHLPDQGWMVLGGEQRTAHFRVLTPEKKRDKRSLPRHTLLYLATPAALKNGWKPSLQSELQATLLTAAIRRYESIGGWKMNQGDATGENKVMRRCVPAGSVYFFDKHIELDQPLTDYSMEIGYGITYEGEW